MTATTASIAGDRRRTSASKPEASKPEQEIIFHAAHTLALDSRDVIQCFLWIASAYEDPEQHGCIRDHLHDRLGVKRGDAAFAHVETFWNIAIQGDANWETISYCAQAVEAAALGEIARTYGILSMVARPEQLFDCAQAASVLGRALLGSCAACSGVRGLGRVRLGVGGT